MPALLTLLLSIVLLPPSASAHSCNLADAEELAQSEFSSSIDHTCQLYSNPVKADFSPLAPFSPDAEKAEMRRGRGDAIFTEIKKNEAPKSPMAQALEAWVNGLIAKNKIATVTASVKVFEINQEKVCEETTKNTFQPYLDGAKDEKVRRGLEETMEREKAVCLRRNYGYANWATREVLLGTATLERLGEQVSRFALLHELCHIQNPAIYGQSNEEVYCDAVAFKWSADLMSTEELADLKKNFSRHIKPENPFEDLLSLRSQLPLCCTQK